MRRCEGEQVREVERDSGVDTRREDGVQSIFENSLVHMIIKCSSS